MKNIEFICLIITTTISHVYMNIFDIFNLGKGNKVSSESCQFRRSEDPSCKYVLLYNDQWKEACKEIRYNETECVTDECNKCIMAYIGQVSSCKLSINSDSHCMNMSDEDIAQLAKKAELRRVEELRKDHEAAKLGKKSCNTVSCPGHYDCRDRPVDETNCVYRKCYDCINKYEKLGEFRCNLRNDTEAQCKLSKNNTVTAVTVVMVVGVIILAILGYFLLGACYNYQKVISLNPYPDMDQPHETQPLIYGSVNLDGGESSKQHPDKYYYLEEDRSSSSSSSSSSLNSFEDNEISVSLHAGYESTTSTESLAINEYERNIN